MKTKSLFGIILIFSTINFIGCKDEDDQLGKGSLPQTAQAFINSHLPDHSVLNVVKTDDNGDELNEKYIVTMSGDIILSFSSMGFWRRIESTSELPQLIQEILLPGRGDIAVKAKYPTETIHMIHFKYYGIVATLSDGSKLAFYDMIGSDKFGLDLTNNPSSWPETSRNLLISNDYTRIAQNNPFYFIKESEEDGSGYRFNTYKSTVFFDKEGEWYYADGEDFSVPPGISGFLPEQSMQVLIDKYGLNTGKIITALVRDEAYYQVKVTLHDGQSKSSNWYLFNPGTGLEMNAPEQAVCDFMKNYIGEPFSEMELQSEIAINVKQVINHFKGKINGTFVMEMYVDRNGNMLSLNLAGSIIPDKVLTYLPEKVQEHAKTYYAGKQIIIIMNGLGNEYVIRYKDNSQLYFDKDGNIVRHL